MSDFTAGSEHFSICSSPDLCLHAGMTASCRWLFSNLKAWQIFLHIMKWKILTLPRLIARLPTIYLVQKYSHFLLMSYMENVEAAPFSLFAEHAYIHDKYFRLIGWTLAEPNMVPNLREQSVDAAYWFFFEASFKLGRITDCDPKVGKNLCKLVFRDVNSCCPLPALPVVLPVARCWGNGQRNANAMWKIGTTGNARPTLF